MKKRKKRLLSTVGAIAVLCTCALLLSITWGTKTKAATGTPITEPITITESGDYYLANDVIGSILIDSDIEVKLDLNGYILSGDGTGSVVKVNAGQLTIKDSRSTTQHPEREDAYITGGLITGGNARYGGGIYFNGTKLVLESGTITGNNAEYGGGIYVGSSGLFVLNGGKVMMNTATIPLGSDNAPLGGGVYVNNATLQMNGGAISYNEVWNNAGTDQSGYGGGLYIVGTLEMKDGEISHNTVDANADEQSCYGGGIYAKGTVLMDGGTISGNQLCGTGKEKGCFGAGIFLRSGTMTVNDVYISGNKVYSLTDKTRLGGGIYNYEGAIEFSGGMIAGNEAYYGGGIYNYSGTVMMSGGSLTENQAYYGAGVYNRKKFTMTDGSILLNFSIYIGGGIYSEKSSELYVKGGSITYNRAGTNGEAGNGIGGGIYARAKTELTGGIVTNNNAKKGGGMYCEGETLLGGTVWMADNVSGGVLEENMNTYSMVGGKANNLFLTEDITFTVGTGENEPQEGMQVGITTEKKPEKTEPIPISTSNASDYHGYFFADGAMREDVVHNSTDSLLYLAIPVIHVTQNADNPVYKTAITDEDFYSVAFGGFGDLTECKLEWKHVAENGTVTWDENSPESTLTITKEGAVTTTAETPAGSYRFRITNNLPEFIEDPESTATPKELMENPLFVCSDETDLVVDKAAQTITAEAIQNITFADIGKTVLASAQGTLSYCVKSGTSVSVNAADGVLTTLEPGDTVITITAAATDNYLAATKDITVSVAVKKIAKPTENTETFTYTGASQTYLPVGYDASAAEISGNVQTAANPTGYTVTVTPKFGYEWSTEGDCSFNWMIAKAPLTVTAKAKEIVFGEEGADNGLEYSGFVNNETEAVLNGSPSYMFLTDDEVPEPYVPGSPVGTYHIVPAGLTSDNYAITFQSGALTVVAKKLDKPQAVDKTYTYTGAEQTFELTGFNEELMTIGDNCKQTAAGTYIVTVTPKDNYAWSTEGDCSFEWNIGKAALTAEASSHTVAYGDAVPAYTVSYSGFVNGEEAPTTAPVLGSTYTTTSTPGMYSVIFTTAPEFANYTVTEVPGVVTVTRAVGATEPTAGNCVYTGVEQAGYSQAGTYVVLEGVSRATNAGSYQFTATPDGNHTWSDGSTEPKTYEWSIAKAPLTVTARTKSIAFGAAAANDGVEYSGFVNGETVAVLNGSLSYTYLTIDETPEPYAPGSPVGTYHIVPTGLTADNYAITFQNGLLQVGSQTIDKPQAVNKTYTYTGAEQTLELTGFNAERMTISDNCRQTAAGTYIVTVTPKDNYSWSTEGDCSFEWNIGKAPLTAEASSHTVAYGDAVPTYTVSYSGFVNGEESPTTAPVLNSTYTTTSTPGMYSVIFTTEPVFDNYAVTATAGLVTVNRAIGATEPTAGDCVYTGVEQLGYSQAGTYVVLEGVSRATNAGSYQFTATPDGNHTWSDGSTEPKTYEWSIAKAPLTVTARTKNIDFGAAAANDGVDYSGFVNGETEAVLSGTLSYTYLTIGGTPEPYTPGSPIGTYHIVPAGLTSDNYAITFQNGSLKVGAQTIDKPQAVNRTYTYTGAEQTFELTGFNAEQMEISDNSRQTAAGIYIVTVTPKDNYTWSTEGNCSFEWNIGKAALTAEASSHTVAYGDAVPTYTVSYSGFVNGEETPTTAPVLSATYTTTSIPGMYSVIFTTDPEFANYTVTTTAGLVTVNRATGATEPVASDCAYTGNEQTGVSQDGTYVVLGGVTRATGAGNYQFTATPDSNHTWSDGTTETKIYNWTIAKAPLTVTARTKSIDFGAAAANDGVEYSGFVNGETEAVLNGVLSYTYLSIGGTPEPYAPGSPIGTYHIVPAGLTADNYAITFQNGLLQVGSQTIDKPQAVNKTYTYTGAEQTLELTGFNEEQMAISDNCRQTAAGTYIVTVTPKGNFVWSTEGDCSFEWNIGKAPLTAEASSHTVVYGDAVPTYTVSYRGFLNGEEAPTTAPVLNSTYTSTSTAGMYSVIFTTDPEFANYTVTTEAGLVTVNRAVGATGPMATDGIYTGEEQSGILWGGTYVVIGGVQRATMAGSYRFTATPDSNHTWADGTTETKIYNWTIAKASVEAPVIEGKVYTGQTLTATIDDEGKAYAVTNNNGGIDAGTYDVVLTLRDAYNYRWTDCDTASKTLDFVIAKKSIDGAAVAYEDAKAYNGQLQTFYVTGVTVDGIPATFTVTGNTARDFSDTDYRMTVYGTGNFEGSIEKPFRITRARVNKPEENRTSFVYNGKNQIYSLAGDERYLVSGNIQQNAGTYSVVVSLKDKNGCEWSDGSNEDLRYSFVIAKAPNAIHNLTVGSNTERPKPPTATADFGTVRFVYATAEKKAFEINHMPEAPGSYIVRAYVEGNDNYESAVREKEFTITKSEDPSGENPSGEDPSGEDPSGEDPSGEDPSGEDPSGEDPSGEDPSGEDPSGKDPGQNPPVDPDPPVDLPDEPEPENPQTYDPVIAPVADVTLEVKLDEEAVKACKSLAGKFEKIGEVYDVRLFKNGEEIQPQELGNGMTVIVRIPVPKKLVGRKFRLVHLHSAEDTGLIEEGKEAGIGTFVIDKNGFIVTKVDRLSKFVFLYQPTCYIHWAALAFLLVYGIAFAIFYVVRRNKVNILLAAILCGSAEIFFVIFAGCVRCYYAAVASFICIGVSAMYALLSRRELRQEQAGKSR